MSHSSQGSRKDFMWFQKRREERGMRGREKTEGEGERDLRLSSLTPSLSRDLLKLYAKQVKNQFLYFSFFLVEFKHAHQRLSKRVTTGALFP